MIEGSWQSSNNRKPQRLPQPHGTSVGADHEIELHGAITSRSRMVERMKAHATCYSPASGLDACHISAVADVLTATGLISTHVIGAENGTIFLGNEYLLVQSHPVGQRAFLAHIAIKRIGLASANDRRNTQIWCTGLIDQAAVGMVRVG